MSCCGWQSGLLCNPEAGHSVSLYHFLLILNVLWRPSQSLVNFSLCCSRDQVPGVETRSPAYKAYAPSLWTITLAPSLLCGIPFSKEQTQMFVKRKNSLTFLSLVSDIYHLNLLLGIKFHVIRLRKNCPNLPVYPHLYNYFKIISLTLYSSHFSALWLLPFCLLPNHSCVNIVAKLCL